MRKFFSRPRLDVIKYRKLIYGCAVLIVGVSIVAMIASGFNWGTDFTGGTELTIKLTRSVDISEIRDLVGEYGYSDAQIQETKDNTYKVRIPERDEEEKAKKELETGISEGLPVVKEADVSVSTESGKTILTVQMDSAVDAAAISSVVASAGYKDAVVADAGDNSFTVTVSQISEEASNSLESAINSAQSLPVTETELIDVKEIGPGWGDKVTKQAVIAFIVFILAVIVYLTLTFEYKMAITAIIELVHDFFVTVGIFALFGIEVTPETVIAVLTILAFSLYDTVVIFDRIQDNASTLTRQSRKTYSDIVNDSVNETFVRSFNTSMIGLIPITSILFLGGATLKAFALPLFIGIIAGAYSSIIFAPPLLAQIKEAEPKYKAFRERAERARSSSKAEPETEKEEPKPKPKSGDSAKPVASQKRAQPAKETDVDSSGGSVEPKSAPKTVAHSASKATQGSKQSASSKAKGPGSGKKKKKKR